MYLLGKLVKGTAELAFLWETETLSEQDDADAQEQSRGGAHGAVAVDALFNPRRITFGGKLLISPNRWGASLSANVGDVIALTDGTLYQCTTPGITGTVAPTWGATSVTDGTATWTKRTALYDCVRWLRDTFDGFFHAGVVQLYLDSDRYHWAQCVARSFTQLENPDVALAWEATFSCADPMRYDNTLSTVTQPLPSSPTTIIVPYGGNAPGAPVLAFAVPACTLDVTVRNSTTGDNMTLSGAVSEGTVTVDCGEGTIAASAGNPPICDLELLTLAAGNNSIVISWTGTGPTSVTITHRDRWW